MSLLMFNDLDWHDTIIADIVIDRKRPGEDDCITMKLIWPNGQRNEICFTGCYYFEASLNFGVVAEETIRWAFESKDDAKLIAIKQKWERLVKLPSLTCFRFETNSTGSAICICAEACEISDSPAG